MYTKIDTARIQEFLGVIFLMGFLLILLFFTNNVRNPDAQSLATDIVSRCTDTTGGSATCYENEVPLLYPQMDIPTVFSVLREIRRIDPTYKFCHVLAHKIGQRVVAEDPSRWVGAVAYNPQDGLCSNGYVHGVIGGRFRAEVLDDATLDSLLPDFRRVCEKSDTWNPSDLDRAICYHGMGHVYDFITNANLSKALELCTKTIPADHQRMCIEGVFMQIYQPLEPDDYIMIAQMPVRPSTTTVSQFCSRFIEPEYEGACRRESWPYFRKSITDGTGIDSFCAGQPNEAEEHKCYQSTYAIAGRMNLGKPGAVTTVCNLVKESEQESCFWTAGQTIIEEDRTRAADTVAFCQSATNPVVAQSCLTSIMRQGHFIFGESEAEYKAFCQALPEHMQSTCFAQIQKK